MPHDITPRSTGIEAADGVVIEADLLLPLSPAGAAVICHPHPLMGGDRHNQVVSTLFESLAASGIATLRFDFRGVGRSSGSYGEGVAERLDAEAALGHLADLAAGAPLWSMGYSFGGDVALSVDHPRLAGWVAIAAPLSRLAQEPPASRDERPAILLVPAHDQFCTPAAAREATSGWTAATVLEVPMADHFLAGALPQVARLAGEAVSGA